MADYLVTVNRRWVDIEPAQAVQSWLESSIFPLRRDIVSDLRAGDLLVFNWGLPRRMSVVVAVRRFTRDIDLLDMGLTAPANYVGVQGTEVHIHEAVELRNISGGIPSSHIAFERLAEDQALGLIDWLMSQTSAEGVTRQSQPIRVIRLQRAVRDIVINSINSDRVLRENWVTWRRATLSSGRIAPTAKVAELSLPDSDRIDGIEHFPPEDPRTAMTDELVEFYDSVALAPFDFIDAIQKHSLTVENVDGGLSIGDEQTDGVPPLDVRELIRRGEAIGLQVDILREGLREATLEQERWRAR